MGARSPICDQGVGVRRSLCREGALRSSEAPWPDRAPKPQALGILLPRPPPPTLLQGVTTTSGQQLPHSTGSSQAPPLAGLLSRVRHPLVPPDAKEPAPPPAPPAAPRCRDSLPSSPRPPHPCPRAGRQRSTCCQPPRGHGTRFLLYQPHPLPFPTGLHELTRPARSLDGGGRPEAQWWAPGLGPLLPPTCAHGRLQG